jgi:hypothetical protein
MSNLKGDSIVTTSRFLPHYQRLQTVTKKVRSNCDWQGIFRSVGKKLLFASSRTSVCSVVVLPVRPPVCIGSATTERIYVQFGIRDFCKNMPKKKIRISLKSYKFRPRGVSYCWRRHMWRNNKQNALLHFHSDNGNANASLFFYVTRTRCLSLLF